MEATGRGNTPCWLFSFWGERVDANLTVKSPHAVQVRPSSFQREVKGMIARLRSLRVEEGGRIVGRVKRWNAAQGIGTVECMPGALVLLEANELAMGETFRYNERLSFKVKKTAAKQKAVEVRRDAVTGHKSGPQS
jgi:hypothetical protein